MAAARAAGRLTDPRLVQIVDEPPTQPWPDTRGLARLLHAALTGYWPGAEQTRLHGLPRVLAGVRVTLVRCGPGCRATSTR